MTAVFAAALTQVVGCLDRLSIEYFVGGSVATIVHGELRTTQDADLVVNLLAERVLELARCLKDQFYVDAEFLAESVRHRIACNVIHKPTGFKVDLFPLRDREFSRTEMARAKHVVVLPGLRLRVASPEDCVLTKLEWYEKGNRVSDRQWRDILGVLKLHRNRLDGDYLAHWAQDLGVGELLRAALADIAN